MTYFFQIFEQLLFLATCALGKGHSMIFFSVSFSTVKWTAPDRALHSLGIASSVDVTCLTRLVPSISFFLSVPYLNFTSRRCSILNNSVAATNQVSSAERFCTKKKPLWMHRAKPKSLKGYLRRSLQRKIISPQFVQTGCFVFFNPAYKFYFRRFESAQQSEGFCPSLKQTWTKSQRNAASSDLS